MAERDRLPILLGTRRYQTDLRFYSRSPLASIRQQIDQGQEPGEQSFDNQGIWKRTSSDFIVGAGQRYFDQEDEADRRRFRKSKGINPWERRQLTLLKDVATVDSAIGDGNNGVLLATASYLFAASNTSISRFDTSDTETAITGAGISGRVTDLTYWGDSVYACISGDIIQKIALSGTTAADFGTTTPKYAKAIHGRLVCLEGNSVYELDNVGAKVGGANIFDHPQPSFEFHTIVGAPNGIYVVGDDNNHSTVWLLNVVDATGEFAAPYPVMELPHGEFIRDMEFYGGVMFLATSRGIRLAAMAGGGFLTFGPVITEPGDVKCLTMWDKFLWFGWTNFDDTSTGLGRLGPEYFSKEMTPAYASDLMATDQGVVHDVAIFNNRPYFIYDAGSACTIVREHATQYVASGSVWSGAITYGTPELKAVLSADARWDPLPENTSVKLEILDGIDGTAQTLFTNTTEDSVTDSGSPGTALEAEELELKLTLTSTTSTHTASPTVRRWTLRTQPLPFRAEEIRLPINLASRVDDAGHESGQDPWEEFTYLHGLMTGRSRSPFAMGFDAETATVLVDSIEPLEGRLFGWDTNRKWPEGWWMVRLITVDA